MMHELGFSSQFGNIRIGNDSTGALSLVSNNSYSARSKHLQLREWFTMELIENGRITVYHVPLNCLPADLLTKNCTKAIHRKLVDQILAYSRMINGGSTQLFKIASSRSNNTIVTRIRTDTRASGSPTTSPPVAPPSPASLHSPAPSTIGF